MIIRAKTLEMWSTTVWYEFELDYEPTEEELLELLRSGDHAYYSHEHNGYDDEVLEIDEFEISDEEEEDGEDDQGDLTC